MAANSEPGAAFPFPTLTRGTTAKAVQHDTGTAAGRRGLEVAPRSQAWREDASWGARRVLKVADGNTEKVVFVHRAPHQLHTLTGPQ